MGFTYIHLGYIMWHRRPATLRRAATGATFMRIRAETLRRERQRKAMTQTDLAVKAGVSYVTVSRLENGSITAPTPTTLRKLADALGIDPEVLIDWGDDEDTKKSGSVTD